MIRANIINAGCLLAASYAEVDAGWLSNAMIFIAASAATLFYLKGYFKKTPPDNEKFRHSDECDKRCSQNLSAHEKIEREMDERLSSMSGHSASSRKEIYARLVRLESELSAIKKENEIQTQRIVELSSKLDRFLER